MNRFVMVEPRNGTIKFITRRLLRKGLLHLFDFRGESREVEIFDGFCGFREDRKYFVRKLGYAAEHHKFLVRPPGDRNHNSGTKHCNDRCVAGEDAKITFDARQVDLIDRTCK